MSLKWDNVALIVAAIALIYVVKRGPLGFFQPALYYSPPASETYNLCVIAMCCITVVGIVKLLTRQDQRPRN